MSAWHSSPPSPDPAPDVSANLAAVKAEIARAAREAGRDPASVTLVADAKSQPAAHARAALAAGHRVFGENRVQEADAKWPALRQEFPDLVLHLIGPLQRNKVKRAIRLFDVIESVDRPEVARAIAEAGAVEPRRPQLFVQVNIGEEPQKAGVLPEETDGLVRYCRDELKLPVRGLMCVPPVDEDPPLYFALLREIARRNGLDDLSMGMSGDFPAAIWFGATFVRVGTAIFGARPPAAD